MNRTWLLVVAGFCTALAHAEPSRSPGGQFSAPESAAFANAQAAVRAALPGTDIASVRPSPVPGLIEVVAGENVLYADPSGRWLVIGHLYDLESATDVTAERLAATVPRLDWDELPLAAAVRIGAGTRRLAVFSDPDCPWCARLHTELREAEDLAVEVILYPLEALHPEAPSKSVAILCAADPGRALDLAMAGTPVRGTQEDPACAARARESLAQALATGERFGVRGTPTLVAPDGRVHAGFLAREALARWLDETPGADGVAP